jgi:uncharacterized protein (DUF433 family)
MRRMADGGTQLLGAGIYTLPQAAALAKVPTSSIRRWVYGYSYEYKGQRVNQPARVAAPADLKEARVITFRDLIEIQFVHAFRTEGVSWKTIKEAADKARELTGSDHPFATNRYVTDGRSIFAEIVQKTGNKELLNVCSNQMAFRRILLPSLRKKVDVSADGIERFYPLGKKVPIVVDPARQFGQPIETKAGVPTDVLARAFKGTRSFRDVARWYDVPLRSVRAAVDFEQISVTQHPQQNA